MLSQKYFGGHYLHGYCSERHSIKRKPLKCTYNYAWKAVCQAAKFVKSKVCILRRGSKQSSYIIQGARFLEHLWFSQSKACLHQV